LEVVQIQRGVGTSTNGDGAFGGSVALSSATPSQQAGGEVSASYGSFNTFNIGGKFSTGLLWNSLILDGAYHQTNTVRFYSRHLVGRERLLLRRSYLAGIG
jgi:hypothetical protein